MIEMGSWPWKKKSSAAAASSDTSVATLTSLASLTDQGSFGKVNYVQISLESYKQLTGLEDEVQQLRERLSEAQSEISTKDGIIKQHAKLAEEAVSGWEKANAEALALRRELESAALAKLAAEDQAFGLDDALKECTRQMRSIRGETEMVSKEAVLAKAKEWTKLKLELEAKVVELNRGLLRAEDENLALSGSLKEQLKVIRKLEEGKSQTKAEIEYLRGKCLSYEKEVNSLKYEIQVISKELEIRNEEKNLSMRLAENAQRQYQQSVKTIAKLEAECQRLHGFLRKKFPGPGAVAKMKGEIDSLHLVKRPNQKEIEFLTARLFAVEDETKMLKEALAARNRLGEQKVKDHVEISAEMCSSGFGSSAPSITSVSEDGIDEEASSNEISGPAMSGSFCRTDFKLEKHEKGHQFELMDDFLVMERLATITNGINGAASSSV